MLIISSFFTIFVPPQEKNDVADANENWPKNNLGTVPFLRSKKGTVPFGCGEFIFRSNLNPKDKNP
jgi:hypothetical protein